MRIEVDPAVIALSEQNTGAFAQAKELEMRGALEAGWYAFLRGTMLGMVPDEELRAKAHSLAEAGEPLPSFDEDA